MNEFQPSVTGYECKRARSRGRSGFGALRSCTLARILASSAVLVWGGFGTYGRRILIVEAVRWNAVNGVSLKSQYAPLVIPGSSYYGSCADVWTRSRLSQGHE